MAKTNLKVVESKRDSLAEACKVAIKKRIGNVVSFSESTPSQLWRSPLTCL